MSTSSPFRDVLFDFHPNVKRERRERERERAWVRDGMELECSSPLTRVVKEAGGGIKCEL